MNRHWSNSRLVRWLRKSVFRIEKPTALGWGEWDEWDEQLKKDKPVGYFVTETLPDILENIPKYTIDHIDNVRIYLSNVRFGTHYLPSNLKRGQWHELEERMLHSLFDSYVDFIEIEVAGSHIAWSKDEDIVKYNIPFHHRHRWLDWGQKFRCPQAAIDHLQWEMTLDKHDPTDPNSGPNGTSPHQAIAAREKMELYTWWKEIRPLRGDSWDASGLRKFWDEMDKKYGDGLTSKHGWLGLGTGAKVMTPAEDRKYKKLSKAADDLEEQWHDEDEQMMIKLIRIRRSAWT